MAAGSFDLSTIRAITPQLGLLILGAVIFVLDLIWKGDKRRLLSWVTSAGLIVIGAVSVSLLPAHPHPENSSSAGCCAGIGLDSPLP